MDDTVLFFTIGGFFLIGVLILGARLLDRLSVLPEKITKDIDSKFEGMRSDIYGQMSEFKAEIRETIDDVKKHEESARQYSETCTAMWRDTFELIKGNEEIKNTIEKATKLIDGKVSAFYDGIDQLNEIQEGHVKVSIRLDKTLKRIKDNLKSLESE